MTEGRISPLRQRMIEGITVTLYLTPANSAIALMMEAESKILDRQ